MNYIDAVKALHGKARPTALLRVYGCQQNVADGDKLRGLLRAMGYEFTAEPSEADLAVAVSCAVREHAEQRLFGQLGEVSKQGKPGLQIVLCGCAAARPETREMVKRSYPGVRLSFGPSELGRFPEYLYKLLTEKKRVLHPSPHTLPIDENLPCERDGFPRAYVTVMTGCDNYCSYCVVPYVRGRERSRAPRDVLTEIQGLVEEGYNEIWLLGQNVNSYRPSFPDLLRAAGGFSGDYTLRFMTSHPRDASPELFRAMADTEKVAPFLHLPAQSGSDTVLRRMNRGYTRKEYLDKIAAARDCIPRLNLTSDIMVGFPGETEQDFCDTLDLIQTARFDSLFTFIYSPRPPAPAADWDRGDDEKTVKERFGRLLALQKKLSDSSKAVPL